MNIVYDILYGKRDRDFILKKNELVYKKGIYYFFIMLLIK